MIEFISKHKKADRSSCIFSLLIPSWNNLPFLKNCIESIVKNSHFQHQIVVIANEANDGTLEWLQEQELVDYVHAKKNIGICYALNIARQLVDTEYIMYVNDDMYLLPSWDLCLKNEVDRIGHKMFMISCTMVEPDDTGNPCVVVRDYGRNLETFNEKDLLAQQESLCRADWYGSTWPPNIVHVDMWDLVGGMSVEFSPGMYSDPDLSKKLYDAGVRVFKGLGDSLVYHFGSKSTKRVRKNKGRKTFLLKWGVTSNKFTTDVLMKGKEYAGGLPEKNECRERTVLSVLKRIKACL